VTNFREANCSTLIIPANPSLSGVSKFPYFPVGGPEPHLPPMKDAHPIMGFVSQWGGMDVGSGMVFASNTVDGLIHQIGGKKLASRLETQLESRERIDEGQAVYTVGVGAYKHLVHTIPPFFRANDSGENRLLQNCYQASLNVAADQMTFEKDTRIACPLLGAGCRGFPRSEAVFHCAEALSNLKMTSSTAALDETKRVTLAFGIPSHDVRERMINAFDTRTSLTEI